MRTNRMTFIQDTRLRSNCLGRPAVPAARSFFSPQMNAIDAVE